MALPQFKIKDLIDHPSAAPDTNHYFDTAHGDVAALQSRIERSFADYSFERAPQSPFGTRFESSVQSLSRAAGIFGFAGTLAGIAYLFI